MGPFEMVVAIIAIITVGKIIQSKHKARHGIIDVEDDDGNVQQRLGRDPDTDHMREEIKVLKDRIQVLERIATDNNSANDINRQIEELRNR